MNPILKKTLTHFGKLALLGAISTVIVGLVALVAGFNIATLPVTYQVFGAMLVPLILSALKTAQSEVATELAQEQSGGN
jgi:hypothetical protein